MIDGSASWRSLGDLTAEQFLSLIPDDSPMKPDAALIQHAASGMTALYAAQAMHESQWGTTGIAAAHPDWHNALGNTVPGSDHVYQQFTSWDAGAAWWKQHVTTYAPYQATTTIAEYVHVYAPASDGNDEAAYVAAIVKVANMVTQTTPAGQYSTAIPGLPGGPLVTSFPIDTTSYMIPASNVYQRPGTALVKPYRWVQHETGNPNSLAAGDAAWVAGGASGIQESMHFEIDDTGCFQLIPVNEVSWQAADGNGPGNMSGVSCELTANSAVWNDPARMLAAIDNAAELGGKIAARMDIAIPQQHWDFNAADPNRHDCPYNLRHVTMPDGTPAWSLFTSLWNAAKAKELGTAGYVQGHPLAPGTIVSNGNIYWYAPQTLPTVTATGRFEYADPNAAHTGPDVPAGTMVNISHVVEGADGKLWVVGTGGSRMPGAAFVKGS